ncbi:unnamed protein product [Heterobilharzia americana]|nr:unnamed protein product [Heterobilharzia americana]
MPAFRLLASVALCEGRVRELLRRAENPSTAGAISKPGFLPPNVRGRTKRLPGFVWIFMTHLLSITMKSAWWLYCDSFIFTRIIRYCTVYVSHRSMRFAESFIDPFLPQSHDNQQLNVDISLVCSRTAEYHCGYKYDLLWWLWLRKLLAKKYQHNYSNINAVRQINETENEELDSEHYAIALGVLVRLMQNERVLLDHLQLTDSPQNSQVLLFTIFKSGSTDILTEGTTLTRLMHRAQGRAEFHMVMSLLVVLRRFSQISNDLVTVLQGIDNVLIDFNQLVLRLLNQSKTTLETYVQFLQQVSERSSSSSTIVPADGTIHELTTNALMYLENLLEFADIIGSALSFTEAGSQATNNTLKYLGNTRKNSSYLEHRLGIICSVLYLL